ncbi:hypothetical protein H4R33_000875 [Dimargaris cristalligena]|nr:hypothetical protein H4R33_000875 [Dimargaris cristalligena]
MVQGTKKLKSVKKTASAPVGIRKGARTIAPKNKTLLQHAKLKKKMNGNVTRNLEHLMATKASAIGKLHVMNSMVKKESKDTKDKKSKK